MTTAKVHQLVVRATTLATDAFDDDAAVAELRDLAQGNQQALEQAIRATLARPASLAIRHRAIELLSRGQSNEVMPISHSRSSRA